MHVNNRMIETVCEPRHADPQVPEELKRAVGCRSLTLSFLSVEKALGGRAALPSSPLLAMPQLRELRLAQVDWKSEDVEAMLDLRQASIFASIISDESSRGEAAGELVELALGCGTAVLAALRSAVEHRSRSWVVKGTCNESYHLCTCGVARAIAHSCMSRVARASVMSPCTAWTPVQPGCA